MLIQLLLATYLLAAATGTPLTHAHVVAIELNGEFVSGGSIIGSNFVLTSGESLTTDYPISLLTVRAGSNFTGRGGTVHSVRRIYQHPCSRQSLAVLHLVEPIRFDEARQPIRLVTAKVKPGDEVAFASWSKNDETPVRVHASSVRKGCGATAEDLFCIDEPRCVAAVWESRNSVHGNPVDVGGRQAGVAQQARDGVVLVADLAAQARWIREAVRRLTVDPLTEQEECREE